MSLHVAYLCNIFMQTHQGTEAYYLFFILSYYENEMYIVLTYVIHTHSNFDLNAILKRNGVIFLFNFSEEVARGWNLIILST
jgi:hypothetical protein